MNKMSPELELREKFQIDVLNLFSQSMIARQGIYPCEEASPGNGSIQIRARVLVFGSGLAEHERRKTAAHLNDQLWLKVADHAVSN